MWFNFAKRRGEIFSIKIGPLKIKRSNFDRKKISSLPPSGEIKRYSGWKKSLKKKKMSLLMPRCFAQIFAEWGYLPCYLGTISKLRHHDFQEFWITYQSNIVTNTTPLPCWWRNFDNMVPYWSFSPVLYNIYKDFP